MLSRQRKTDKAKIGTHEEELGGQMSFLEHLDELRKRLIRSMAFVLLAAMACWFLSDRIYNFLARPVMRALADADQHHVQIAGLNGKQTSAPISSLKAKDKFRYIFPQATKLGSAMIPAGASVAARVDKDNEGKLGVFTDEALSAGDTIVPKDVRLPMDLNALPGALPDPNDKLIVTTALEPFALYVKVSLYAALVLSVPFLLWQIWAFVSPGLYPHERKYLTPFIPLSTIFFIFATIVPHSLTFLPPANH